MPTSACRPSPSTFKAQSPTRTPVSLHSMANWNHSPGVPGFCDFSPSYHGCCFALGARVPGLVPGHLGIVAVGQERLKVGVGAAPQYQPLRLEDRELLATHTAPFAYPRVLADSRPWRPSPAGGLWLASARSSTAAAYRRAHFKAALNVAAAVEQPPGDCEPNGVVAFETASTLIELRPTGPLTQDRGRNSCLPPAPLEIRLEGANDPTGARAGGIHPSEGTAPVRFYSSFTYCYERGFSEVCKKSSRSSPFG
jgi:hypothetical protein